MDARIKVEPPQAQSPILLQKSLSLSSVSRIELSVLFVNDG